MCFTTYSTKIVSQFAISATFPQFTTGISSLSYAYSFSKWRNWCPAKWNDLNKTLWLVTVMTWTWTLISIREVIYSWDNWDFFTSSCSFSPQTTTTKHLLWEKCSVSMRQKTMVQSQCYIWQVNNLYIGGYSQGIITKEVILARLGDTLMLLEVSERRTSSSPGLPDTWDVTRKSWIQTLVIFSIRNMVSYG